MYSLVGNDVKLYHSYYKILTLIRDEWRVHRKPQSYLCKLSVNLNIPQDIFFWKVREGKLLSQVKTNEKKIRVAVSFL